MPGFWSHMKLTARTTVLTLLLLIVTIGVTSLGTVQVLRDRTTEQVIDRQSSNLRIATVSLGITYPELTTRYDGEGNVARLILPAIPDFTNHSMIDEIGRLTGETATVFAYEPENGDFWRRTTNIIKPDGNRAIGTPLGTGGAVHSAMIRGETYQGEATILGQDYYTIYEPIFAPDGDVIGILYAGVLKAEIMATLNAVTSRLLLISAVMLAVASLVAWLAYRRMLRPIPRIASVMGRLSEGAVEVDVPFTTNHDEIGEIARAVEVFREGLSENARLRAEQIAAAEQAEASKRATMGALADQFEDAVGQIVAKVGAASRALDQETNAVAAAVRDSGGTATSVASSASDALQSVQSVASAAEELSTSINEVSRQMGDANRATQEAGQKAQATNEIVTSMRDMADRIGEVVSLISAIAEQTNLLALNATIEAARAGEAGKGFAVVAQEVKSLATQTARATEEIGQRITEIQGVSEKTVAAIDGIGGTIERITTIATNVGAAVEQQTAATAEIARNAQEAASNVGGVSAGIQTVSRGSQSAGTAIAVISDASGELVSTTEGLTAAVTDFVQQVRAA